jgi:hypothetical protein
MDSGILTVCVKTIYYNNWLKGLNKE